MNDLDLTGGARVGKLKITFPFASLKVTKDCLELNASVIGNLIFKPSDIISIKPYIKLPILGQGIQITHKVSTYKDRVIFWTIKDPSAVIEQIHNTGFFDAKTPRAQIIDSVITTQQSKGGCPIKRDVVIGGIAILNLLILKDFLPFYFGETASPIGKGMLMALLLFFVIAFLSLLSVRFRQLILKEGRRLKDIKRVAVFVTLVSGLILLTLGASIV